MDAMSVWTGDDSCDVADLSKNFSMSGEQRTYRGYDRLLITPAPIVLLGCSIRISHISPVRVIDISHSESRYDLRLSIRNLDSANLDRTIEFHPPGKD